MKTYKSNQWKPTALSLLHLRAKVFSQIRQFFSDRQVLEVETPLLSQATVTDPHLHSFETRYHLDESTDQRYYLQTSPEFAMKRLLAAGSGPIYQITKAFRNQGELGRYHNPEFTLLEWYQPGFNHHSLMDEVEDLLKTILHCESAQRFSYAKVFQDYLQIDPHSVSLNELKQTALRLNLSTENLNLRKIRDYLNLLMAYVIEPQLPPSPLFIYDFPVSLAALSKIRPGDPPIAERFEVYIKGIELANGFHELNNEAEQRERFICDLKERASYNSSQVPMDEQLLQALKHGLPNCSGVALGLDRLLMLIAKTSDIAQVISFPMPFA